MANLLNRITKASSKFLVPLTLEETYRIIIEGAIKLVQADEGSIFTYKNKELTRVYATSPILYSYKPRLRGNLYKAIKLKKPSVLEASKVTSIHPELGKLPIKSVIHIPLINGNQSFGIMVFYSEKKDPFSQDDLDVLNLFGSLASLAIRKAQLYTESRDALNLRDQFISIASHELRTPLTSISGYSELLNDKKNDFPKKESNWINNLHLEVIRLSLLMKELLDINQVKSGHLVYQFKECHLNQIINRSIENMSFTYPNHKIKVKSSVTEKQDLVIADYDKLIQVINNVLDNALKFNHNKKPVKLTLSSTKNYLVIKVQDFGKGIQESEIPFVFESFYKGKNSQSKGMGLGLFLVKSIVQSHQGSITISSKNGFGTIVEIKLPKAPK